MRELKFRAWNKRANQWWNKGEPWDFEEMCGWEDWPRDCRFDELILMQSTGLKDKNGKEIFEGDIVLLHWDHDYSDEAYKRKHTVVAVEWGTVTVECANCEESEETYTGWCCRGPIYTGNQLSLLRCGEDPKMEVIGNIHENPELLPKS